MTDLVINPSTQYHRFNVAGETVNKDNLHLQRPDPYRSTSTNWIGFEWLGCIDKCGTHYTQLQQMIDENGGTAVGLKFELAATPNRVELEAIWWENMVSVPGLTVALSVVDIDGAEFAPLPIGDIDLGSDPNASSMSDCCDCGPGDDTFDKYRFDRTGNAMKVGRCNTAKLILEIKSEPDGGLLGSNCTCSPTVLFRGGFGFEGFCIERGIESYCGMNFSCLDGCPS